MVALIHTAGHSSETVTHGLFSSTPRKSFKSLSDHAAHAIRGNKNEYEAIAAEMGLEGDVKTCLLVMHRKLLEAYEAQGRQAWIADQIELAVESLKLCPAEQIAEINYKLQSLRDEQTDIMVKSQFLANMRNQFPDLFINYVPVVVALRRKTAAN